MDLRQQEHYSWLSGVGLGAMTHESWLPTYGSEAPDSTFHAETPRLPLEECRLLQRRGSEAFLKDSFPPHIPPAPCFRLGEEGVGETPHIREATLDGAPLC